MASQHRPVGGHEIPTKEEARKLEELRAELEKLPTERQAELLDRLSGPTPPRQKVPRHNTRLTSVWAKRAIEKEAASMREVLLDLFTEAGEEGATDSELHDRTGWLMQTISPLRGGLVLRGLVVKTERCRPTPSGRAAYVWVLREHATPEEIKASEEWHPTGNRRRVLDALLVVGPRGLTDQAGSSVLRMSLRSYRQARNVLKEAGLVVDAGRVEKGKRGQKRKVWIATEPSEGGES